MSSVEQSFPGFFFSISGVRIQYFANVGGTESCQRSEVSWLQGSHSTWKTWKNEGTPGKPGNMEFCKI